VSPSTASLPVAVVATEETAAEWADALSANRIPAVAVPWARVTAPVDPDAAGRVLAAGDHDLVLLTSQNVLRFLPVEACRGRPAAAVGRTTAAAARAAGFEVVEVGHTTAEALARRLAERFPRRVLWLRGEAAREVGADVLAARGWTVTQVVAYRARPDPGFAAALRDVGPPRAWVVGSPAAASALQLALGEDAFPPIEGGPFVVVPGETTAATLRIPGRVEPMVAPDPSVEGIERAVRLLFGT
jgi:uroporphyrinogen-III synthase